MPLNALTARFGPVQGAILPGDAPGAAEVTLGALTEPVGAGLGDAPAGTLAGLGTKLLLDGVEAVFPGEVPVDVVCGAEIEPVGAGEAV